MLVPSYNHWWACLHSRMDGTRFSVQTPGRFRNRTCYCFTHAIKIQGSGVPWGQPQLHGVLWVQVSDQELTSLIVVATTALRQPDVAGFIILDRYITQRSHVTTVSGYTHLAVTFLSWSYGWKCLGTIEVPGLDPNHLSLKPQKCFAHSPSRLET